ncbi:MAG TPA: PRC-barrel domain-containing protein [Terriglobales bacterium]|nr:PRC-barrel domain-containing protein [Terriglobales bacterium]
MAHYGTLGDYKFATADPDDIRGSSVYGLEDEKLGKIDDVIFDHSTGNIQYAVVDTGGWLHHHKFLVPANRLGASTKHKDDFEVGVTKQQIESFPPYNESDLKSDEKWADYEGKYRSKWETGPVMHRAETDRNITPTPAQMTKGTGATGPQNDEVQGGMNVVPSSKTVLHSGTSTQTGPTSDAGVNRTVTPVRRDSDLQIEPSGPGRRWSSFEEKLRARRQEIVTGCSACGTQPSGERLSERERKVS